MTIATDQRRQPRAGVAGGLGGPVPWENIGGRAEFITFSLDGSTVWWNPLTWFEALRRGPRRDLAPEQLMSTGTREPGKVIGAVVSGYAYCWGPGGFPAVASSAAYVPAALLLENLRASRHDFSHPHVEAQQAIFRPPLRRLALRTPGESPAES